MWAKGTTVPAAKGRTSTPWILSDCGGQPGAVTADVPGDHVNTAGYACAQECYICSCFRKCAGKCNYKMSSSCCKKILKYIYNFFIPLILHKLSAGSSEDALEVWKKSKEHRGQLEFCPCWIPTQCQRLSVLLLGAETTDCRAGQGYRVLSLTILLGSHAMSLLLS